MSNEDNCPICLAKEKVENVIRGFLRENGISHLDAIINLIQSHNVILEKLEKSLGKTKTIDLLKTLTESQQETFNLACHISMRISDEIENIKGDFNGIPD